MRSLMYCLATIILQENYRQHFQETWDRFPSIIIIKITASVTVTNSGNFDGEEVVQLYIRDVVGSITRPLKELKGFQKVFLKKRESKKITFIIGINDLKFYNYDLKWIAEPGDFEVMIGTNCDQINKSSFKLLK